MPFTLIGPVENPIDLGPSRTAAQGPVPLVTERCSTPAPFPAEVKAPPTTFQRNQTSQLDRDGSSSTETVPARPRRSLLDRDVPARPRRPSSTETSQLDRDVPRGQTVPALPRWFLLKPRWFLLDGDLVPARPRCFPALPRQFQLDRDSSSSTETVPARPRRANTGCTCILATEPQRRASGRD